MSSYLDTQHPGPGSGPSRSDGGNGPGHSRKELGIVVALAMLRLGIGSPKTWLELLANTNAKPLHKRFNAFGDAVGAEYLALDRAQGNKLAMTEANMVRCAHWLRDSHNKNRSRQQAEASQRERSKEPSANK